MHKPDPVSELETVNEWFEPIEDVQPADPKNSLFGRLSMMRSVEHLIRDPRSLNRLEENAEAMPMGISLIKSLWEPMIELKDYRKGGLSL